jgi:uncharacterized repeat protein (TIGR02543 family)
MRNSTKKITAIAAALLLSVSGVATTAAMAAPAVFATTTVTATFESNGGSTVEDQVVVSGGSVTKPTDPTKPGYTFAGWYTDSKLSTPASWSEGKITISGDVTYYAKWTASSSTTSTFTAVTEFGYAAAKEEADATLGVSDTGTDTFWVKLNGKLGTKRVLLEVTTSDGTVYSAVGGDGQTDLNKTKLYFTTENNGSTDFVNGVSTKGATKYTAPTFKTNEKVTLSVYTYDAASTVATGAQPTSYNQITNKTLIGEKEITISAGYVVTLDPNGGTISDSTAQKKVSVASGSKIVKATTGVTPTKTGYDFTGWYTDAACTKKYDENEVLTGNVTLYAGYKATSEAVNVTNIGYAASAITTPVTASAGNYWVTLDNKIGTGRYLVEVVTADGTRYSQVVNGTASASSENESIVVALNSVDYINKVARASVAAPTAPTAGSTVTVSVYTYTCNNTETGKNTAAVNAYSDMTNLTLVAQKAITIADSYTVSFDTQGGSTVANDIVAASGTATKPNNPTKAGYDFTGWYTDAACTKAYDFTTAVTENITLYAGWTMSANNIAGATIATIANVAYTGEAQTPALTVTLGDKTLVQDTDYTVEYTNNTEAGKATATITGIGAYTGTATKNFVIVPQQVTGLKAVKKTATTLKLQFNAVEGADGYKIYDAVTGKAIASVSTQNGATVLKKTITGLNAGETRKYKVRAYKIVNGTKRYAEYSAVYTKATAKK